MTQRQAATQTVTALDGVEISPEMESMLARMEARKGDPSKMTSDERENYVATMCRALRLNPLTRPVQFILLSGREVLYVTRTATDQLAAMHSLNRKTVDGPRIVDIMGTKVGVCTVEVSLPNGRSETATATLPAVDPVNLYMKLETKAKRRATLSILGLGVLTEEETETIPGARKVDERPRDFHNPTPPQGSPAAPSLDGLGIEPGNVAAAHRNSAARAGADTARRPSQPPTNPDAEDPGPGDDVAQPAPVEAPPVLVSFYQRVAAIELPGESVAVWVKHRAELATMPAPDREAAWKALCLRTEECGRLKNGKVWLKKALAEHDARGAEAA